MKLLASFPTDTTCELHIFRHDGHSPSVNGEQVGILHETNEVGLGCFLKCEEGCKEKRKREGRVVGRGGI